MRADDERATSPGDVLRELFNNSALPILIDEWVAYARQLHDQSDLPAGSFETQFCFAQVLTESAKLAPNCLLVISLPASDNQPGLPIPRRITPRWAANGVAKPWDRLRNVAGGSNPPGARPAPNRVRDRAPALVRATLRPAQFKDRDVVARTFADFYRVQSAEFPPECHDADYEARLKAAYPITLRSSTACIPTGPRVDKFQRTRGVLRLMAAVIHSLWKKATAIH